jgi:hypothetical protein
MGAAPCRRHLLAAVPDKLHPVRPENGLPGTHRTRDHSACRPLFERVGQEPGLDHRLTTTTHPWTHGQVERLSRTLKAAPVRTSDAQTHQPLKAQLHAFQRADNFAKGLQTLKGLTPYEDICQCWHKQPERFTVNPCHHTLGLNT